MVDVDGFESFLRTHYASVTRALAVALGDPGRAEDLAQEGFARALACWPQVSGMERPVAWVYVVAMNQARRDLRREQRSDPGVPQHEAEDVAGGVATSVSVATALAALAPRQRATVVLRYLADLSTAQVAEALGCAEGTVKSTLHRALASLRVEMEEDSE